MGTQQEAVDVPEGFEPLFRTSPFLDCTGPYFYKKTGDSFVVGLRVLGKHTNVRGTLHGGFNQHSGGHFSWVRDCFFERAANPHGHRKHEH
jgi:hypothetical protein